MAKITDYYKIVPNSRLGGAGLYQVGSNTKSNQNSMDLYSVSTSSTQSLQNTLKFTSNRLQKYTLYDQMDKDIDICRALNTIADEMTPINKDSNLPFNIHYNNDIDEEVDENLVVTIRSALYRWSRIYKFDNRLWSIVRYIIKYGDCFFIKVRRDGELHRVWKFVDVRDVTGIGVNAETNEIKYYQIKSDSKSLTTEQKARATDIKNGVFIPSSDMVHFSLFDETKDTYPFGESVLSTIYRTFKQLELLEDSLIIYRVVRAPERRVFYVDTGKMSPQKSAKYIEKVKNDIRQKRVPVKRNGDQNVDSTYNPESMIEDFFLAQPADGRGSKIETLPGGCLDLATMIPLLDGRELSLSELITEYKIGKENWVYSADQNGGFLPGKISWAGVTHTNAEVYELVLDNGKKVIATSDHKFPVWGRGIIRLDELNAGDSIISHNTDAVALKDSHQSTYTRVYDHSTKKWEFVHRKVSSIMESKGFGDRFIHDDSLDNRYDVVHHKDFNRYNNNPSNLVKMGNDDHTMYHAMCGERYLPLATARHQYLLENDTIYKQANTDNLKDALEIHLNLLKTDDKYYSDFCESVSVGLSNYIANLSPEDRNKRDQQSIDNFYLGYCKEAEKRKNDIEYSKHIYKKSSDTLSKTLKTPGVVRDNCIDHLREIRHPADNQEINFSKDMLTMLNYYFDNGIIEMKELAYKLNHTSQFIDLWELLNNQQDRKMYRISKEFKTHHIKMLVQAFGYNDWDDYKNKRLTNLHIGEDSLKTLEETYNSDEVALLKATIDIAKISSKPYLLQKNLGGTDIELDFSEKYKKVITNKQKLVKVKASNLENVSKYFGYDNFQHLISDASLFNHRVVSVTKLEQKMDVGTLTIDRDEEIHSFHNFALSVGIQNFNSNLGELQDLFYFQDKLFRGLNIPVSYMVNASDKEGATVNDGRVGTAYIQELRFVRYIMRLQELIDGVFDKEFKIFLKDEKINITTDDFSLKFNPPQNFAIYRELELAGDLLNTFQSANDIPFMSKRYALMKYMNWSEEDIQLNETLLKQERGITGTTEKDIIDPTTNEPTGKKDSFNELRQIYDPKAHGE